MTPAIDHKAVSGESRAMWNESPHLHLAYFDFDAFHESRVILALERGAPFAQLLDDDEHERIKRRELAIARLRAAHRPLSAEPLTNLVRVDGDRIEVWLYGLFGDQGREGEFCETLIERAVAANPNAKTIELRIASSGGLIEILDRMVSVLQSFDGDTRAVVDFATASSGSYIALACKHVAARAGTTLMLHRVHRAIHGNAAVLREAAADLEAIDTRLLQRILAARPDADAAAVKRAIESETYLTAEDALRLRLIDEILPAIPMPEELP